MYIIYIYINKHTHTNGNHMILAGKFSVRICTSRNYTQNTIIKLHNYNYVLFSRLTMNKMWTNYIDLPGIRKTVGV